jgi:hypothetical protein
MAHILTELSSKDEALGLLLKKITVAKGKNVVTSGLKTTLLFDEKAKKGFLRKGHKAENPQLGVNFSRRLLGEGSFSDLLASQFPSNVDKGIPMTENETGLVHRCTIFRDAKTATYHFILSFCILFGSHCPHYGKELSEFFFGISRTKQKNTAAVVECCYLPSQGLVV